MPIEWALLLAFALTSTAGVVAPWLHRRRLRRAVAELPPLTPDTTEGSVVHVVGRVRALNTLVAPLSGVTCVMASSRITLRARMLRNVAATHALTRLRAFVIEREGQPDVLIDGPHVRLSIPPVKLRWVAGEVAEAFLRACKLSPDHTNGAHYDEMALVPGARVSAAGLLIQDIDDAPPEDERTFRAGPRIQLRLAGDAERPVLIVDAERAA